MLKSIFYQQFQIKLLERNSYSKNLCWKMTSDDNDLKWMVILSLLRDNHHLAFQICWSDQTAFKNLLYGVQPCKLVLILGVHSPFDSKAPFFLTFVLQIFNAFKLSFLKLTVFIFVFWYIQSEKKNIRKKKNIIFCSPTFLSVNGIKKKVAIISWESSWINISY